MKLISIFTTLFRKYIFFRVLTIISLCGIVAGISSFVNQKTVKIPILHSIDPEVGSPGDIMTVKGENFGAIRNSNYVEIGGSKISSSGYLSWTDTQIKLVLPASIQDGLVIVGTSEGRSSPKFFANEVSIPVKMPVDEKSSLPSVDKVSPQKGSYGTLITISGSNFGSVRGNSKVLFTANFDTNAETSSASKDNSDSDLKFMNTDVISALDENFDYEYWSDSEIRVRIPEGAATGLAYVETETGKSGNFTMEIVSPVGERSYSVRTTYLVQSSADISSNQGAKTNTTVTIRIPRPLTSSQQPYTELTSTMPLPMIVNYQDTVIYQGEIGRTGAKKLRFSQDFVIAVYSVETSVTPSKVKQYADKNSVVYQKFTAPDRLVPCDNAEIIALGKSIVKKEKNPYIQAKLVYDYMIENFDIDSKTRSGKADIFDLLDRKRGDAYDFSVIYCAVLRSLGIPCASMAGILVDSEMVTQNHWWNEFYIENFGWIPVDVSMGAGLEYKKFRALPLKDDGETVSDREYYFGNLDAQHIAFSKTWNEIKTSSDNSKIVYRPRTYAFQSVWEESTSEVVNYSSLWNVPSVLGVY